MKKLNISARKAYKEDFELADIILIESKKKMSVLKRCKTRLIDYNKLQKEYLLKNQNLPLLHMEKNK